MQTLCLLLRAKLNTSFPRSYGVGLQVRCIVSIVIPELSIVIPELRAKACFEFKFPSSMFAPHELLHARDDGNNVETGTAHCRTGLRRNNLAVQCCCTARINHHGQNELEEEQGKANGASASGTQRTSCHCQDRQCPCYSRDEQRAASSFPEELKRASFYIVIGVFA
jgi:hypothetical protein